MSDLRKVVCSLAATLFLLSTPLQAKIIYLKPQDDLQAVIETSEENDILILAENSEYQGPILIEHSLTLIGASGSRIQGNGKGRVIWVKAPHVRLQQLEVSGSGFSLFDMDAAIYLDRQAKGAVVFNNRIIGNLFGIYVQGADHSLIAGNTVIGDDKLRMSERGNGIQIWNAPHTLIIDNHISMGRDGIYVTNSRFNRFAYNTFSELRFAIHYMYTEDSIVDHNYTEDSDAAYVLMFSDRLWVMNNRSDQIKEHGILLNSVNFSYIAENDIHTGNKCVFIYASAYNAFRRNHFSDCNIGIHFTAGSENNHLRENAFISNQTQVKYVGTRYIEWSDFGRGNYWSDHASFDLNGDGIADTPYRPNSLMDGLLWKAPNAKILQNAPALQIIHWAQQQFPALHPGGVQDSAPLMAPFSGKKHD